MLALRFVRSPLGLPGLTLSCLAIAASLSNVAPAQQPQIPASRLGVDLIRLKDGTRLYGFVLDESTSDALTLAIERSWLEKTYPDLCRRELETERASREQARSQLLARIDEWIEQRPHDELLLRFLNSERSRLEEDPDASPRSGPMFFAMAIPSSQVKDYRLAKPANRRLGGLAFEERLEHVTTTSASVLQHQLEQLGVDVSTRQVDLSDRMPSLWEQSDRQWLARKALVEYHYRQPLEFQGTLSKLTRKGDKVDVAGLASQMLASSGLDAVSNLGAELGLPEFQRRSKPTDDGSKEATRVAEREGFLGVRITQLDQSLLADRVEVISSFFAISETGEWFQVCRFSAIAAAADQSDEDLARVQQDPQVLEARKWMQGLGLDIDARWEQALRQGAATEKALQAADSQFQALLQRTIRQLDAGRIPLSQPESP